MAYYGDKKNVKVAAEKGKQKYEDLLKPGGKPQWPGIYKCQTCGYEDVINRECGKLPPCSHCSPRKNEHWKLLVRAENVTA